MFQVKIYKDQNNEVSVGTMSASQSSLWHDNKKHAASTCLDGNKVNHKGESDSHDCRTSDKTKDMVRPWWEVDLGAETTVYKVRIEQVAFRAEEHNLRDLDIQLISKDDVVLAIADTKAGLPYASDCRTLKNDNSESCGIQFTTNDSNSGFIRNKCINKCQSDLEAVLKEETNKWKVAQPTVVVGQCNKVSCEYMY
jgi:hypothetical protein